MAGSYSLRLSIMSYNMHGFNQGSTMLYDICNQNCQDIIFIQEHWLSSALIDKILCISANYVGYGISAMEAALSINILKGRPFGGTAVLVKNKYAKLCSSILTFDRVVSLVICNVLFINTYMPCEDGSIASLDCLQEILANVTDIVEQSSHEYIVFGGDLNVNLFNKSAHSLAINDFLSEYKLTIVQRGNV